MLSDGFLQPRMNRSTLAFYLLNIQECKSRSMVLGTEYTIGLQQWESKLRGWGLMKICEFLSSCSYGAELQTSAHQWMPLRQ